MALFPLLQFQPGLAAPLPPASLSWLSLYYADEAESRIEVLADALLAHPWLLTIVAFSQDEFHAGPPTDLPALASALEAFLLRRQSESLIVGEVEQDDLDQWRAAAARTSSLAAQLNLSGESQQPVAQPSFGREHRAVFFSESFTWLRRVDSAGQVAKIGSPPAATPNWLSQLVARLEAETLDDDPAIASIQRVRKRLIAGESTEVWRPNPEALFAATKPAKVESFATTVVRLAKIAQRRQDLEDRFAESLEEEKLQALKELAYGASHEVNNPLANIATRAQTLLRDESDPDRRRSLATINAQAFRAHEMVSDMMLFARPPRLEVASLDLAQLAQEVLDELQAEAAQQNTALLLESEGETFWEADRAHLGAALRAICLNSLEALRADGSITIRVRAENAASSSQVCLEVEDTGPGIPEEIRPRIFEPYFSGREAGRGLGLGLCKAWSIVNQHQGRIEVHPSSPQGTTMRILLPLSKLGADLESPDFAPAQRDVS